MDPDNNQMNDEIMNSGSGLNNNLKSNSKLNNNNGQKGSGSSSFLGKTANLINDYNNSGSLANLAKDKIKDGIKNKASEKYNAKKAQLKNAAKNKINSKLPDSVKQKKDALKNKTDAIKDKVNAPKKKLDETKSKINEQAFKKGVKAAANAVAPGTGEVAEKLLETPVGEEAVDAARDASNPISAVKEGTKKLVSIVVKRQVVTKIIFAMIPFLIGGMFFIVFFLGFAKFADGWGYFSGMFNTILTKYQDDINGSSGGRGSPGNTTDGVSLDENFVDFYDNINKYVDTNKPMVVAVLTGFKHNDWYSSKKKASFEDDCSDEELENGKCDTSTDMSVSKIKMKRYIKKVNKAIKKSNNDITEGDYDDPENTGSNFFRWLYTDFVDDYYKEYLGNLTGDKLAEKKEEIIHFIYLYYKELAKNNTDCSNSYVNLSCPQITVSGGDYAGTYSLEEYVEGVVAAELGYSGYPEALKAQAIAARTFAIKYTDNCTKSIVNSTNAQTFNPSKVNADVKKAVADTAGLVLTDNGNVISSEYSSFTSNHSCSGNVCTGKFKKLPSQTEGTVSIDLSKVGIGLSASSLAGGHNRGMSQYAALYFDRSLSYSYKEILKYFYDPKVDITATSVSNGNNSDHSTGVENVRFTTFTDANVAASIDKSKLSTNAKGWKVYDEGGKKYVVVAAATEKCRADSNCGDTTEKYNYIKYYNLFDKMIIKVDGVEYDAIVLDHCGACMWSKDRRGDTSNNRIDIWVNSGVSVSDYGSFIDNASLSTGSVCGYSGNGLVNIDGYSARMERPARTNTFFYDTKTNTAANGWLEGECAWYASGRAQEVLTTLNNGAKWTYNGDGGTFCDSADAKKFVTSTDYTKPQVGAIVSWKDGKYGHVGVIEKVDASGVTISEAGLSYGPTSKYGCSTGSCVRPYVAGSPASRRNYCESDGSGCFRSNTVSLDRVNNYLGKNSFVCYVYLGQPK